MGLKLNSLKINSPDTGKVSEEGRRPNYGYGTSLYLDDVQLKALGITKPFRAGTIVNIEAKGIVESAGESVESHLGHNDDEDKVEIRMTVQLTDMGMEEDGEADDPASVLYKTS